MATRCVPPHLPHRRHARWTTSTGNSRPAALMSCACRTSPPISPLDRAGCTWSSWWMCTARRIVGWRVICSMQKDFVLDSVEQALYYRQPSAHALTHHSSRGSQYVSICYTRTLGPGRHTALSGQPGLQLRQRAAQAELIHCGGGCKTRGIRGAGHPAAGARVQLRPTAYADWGQPSGRI